MAASARTTASDTTEKVATRDNLQWVARLVGAKIPHLLQDLADSVEVHGPHDGDNGEVQWVVDGMTLELDLRNGTHGTLTLTSDRGRAEPAILELTENYDLDPRDRLAVKGYFADHQREPRL